MTEDEAKTKWCPTAGASRFNRQDELCMASGCMAWRRNVAMFDRMTGEPAIPGVAAIGDLEPRYTSHGYCGLAGAPQ